MLTFEHFEAVRQLRQAALNLTLAVTAIRGPTTALHVAFDPKVETKATRREQSLLRKIK